MQVESRDLARLKCRDRASPVIDDLPHILEQAAYDFRFVLCGVGHQLDIFLASVALNLFDDEGVVTPNNAI